MLKDLLDTHMSKLRSEMDSKFIAASEDAALLQKALLQELRGVRCALGDKDDYAATAAAISSSSAKKTVSVKEEDDASVDAFYTSLSGSRSAAHSAQPLQPVLPALNSDSTSPSMEVSGAIVQTLELAAPPQQSERKRMEPARVKENNRVESVKDQRKRDSGEEYYSGTVRPAQKKISGGDMESEIKSFHGTKHSVQTYDSELPRRAQKDVSISSSKAGKAGPRKSRSMLNMQELSSDKQMSQSPPRQRSAERARIPLSTGAEKSGRYGSSERQQPIPSQRYDGKSVPGAANEIVFADAGPRGAKVGQAFMDEFKGSPYGDHHGYGRSRRSSISGPVEDAYVERVEVSRRGTSSNRQSRVSVSDSRLQQQNDRISRAYDSALNPPAEDSALQRLATEFTLTKATSFQKLSSRAP